MIRRTQSLQTINPFVMMFSCQIKIMQELFDNLHDCHPNFVHTQEKRKTSEKSGVKNGQKMPCQKTDQFKEEKSKK